MSAAIAKYESVERVPLDDEELPPDTHTHTVGQSLPLPVLQLGAHEQFHTACIVGVWLCGCVCVVVGVCVCVRVCVCVCVCV